MRKYFAATQDPAELGKNLRKKIDEYETWSRTADVIDLQERAYLYYFGTEYGGRHATSEITRGGEQGELAEYRVNHSRALAQTLFNLIAASKVVWQPVAVNSDYDSASQATLAQNILEFYWQDRKVAQFCQRALEESIVFGEGFVFTEWDETLGEPYAADETTGQTVYTGDVRFTTVMSRTLIRDPNKPSFDELDWVMVPVARNAFDLAARYPEFADAILKEEPAKNTRDEVLGNAVEGDSDDVLCYYFFHKTTPAMPDGLEAVLVGKEVLRFGPLSYKTFPLHRVHHSEVFGTPYAYTPYFEVLGVQELMDSLESSIASNQTAFATQNVLVPLGSTIEPDSLQGGLNVIYYPPTEKEPKALQLCATPQEVFAHLQTKKKDQEQLMGLNSVVRGEPLTGDQSGAALALLQAQAVQQSSGLQANYLRMVESVGNAVLELVKRCPLPRRIAISGKATRFMQKEQEFTSDSIRQIRKVMVEAGNPLIQTPSGRVTVGKELMANGLIKTGEQYLTLIQTGRLDPMTQGVTNQMLLIMKENEQILDGIVPVLSPDDNDPLHAVEHQSVMASPEARQDPRIIAAYTEHMQGHHQNWLTKDPTWSMMLGQPPPPQMMPPPGAPPPGAPPGPPPPGGPNETPPSSAEQPGLPNMPTNPATGERAPMPDSGAVLADTE